MSLQKTRVPALLTEAGAWIDEPDVVVVAAVVAALFVPPPHPAATRETRTTRAPASAVSFERDTAGLLSLIGLPKIRLSDLLVAKKRLRVVGERHRPGLEHIAAARHVQRHHGVLLDEQDGRALLVDLHDGLEDALHEDRREPHRGLIQAEQRGVRHQRTRDRDHLLLASGERARALLLALGEPREERVDAV